MIDKSNPSTIEDKLRSLCFLQLIDSALDEIKNLQGKLPIEIETLEKEIRLIEQNQEESLAKIQAFESEIKGKKSSITEADKTIEKYKIQIDNVKNDREFGSLEKEIEYKNLEIQSFKKNIKELQIKKEEENKAIEKSKEIHEEKKGILAHKKETLDVIIQKNAQQEEELRQRAKKIETKIEKNLLKIYQNIRKKVEDSIAIVVVERGAPLGSFLVIPAQKYLEIQKRTQIIIDEHSGRILVDRELMEEVRGQIQLY